MKKVYSVVLSLYIDWWQNKFSVFEFKFRCSIDFVRFDRIWNISFFFKKWVLFEWTMWTEVDYEVGRLHKTWNIFRKIQKIFIREPNTFREPRPLRDPETIAKVPEIRTEFRSSEDLQKTFCPRGKVTVEEDRRKWAR